MSNVNKLAFPALRAHSCVCGGGQCSRCAKNVHSFSPPRLKMVRFGNHNKYFNTHYIRVTAHARAARHSETCDEFDTPLRFGCPFLLIHATFATFLHSAPATRLNKNKKKKREKKENRGRARTSLPGPVQTGSRRWSLGAELRTDLRGSCTDTATPRNQVPARRRSFRSSR